MPYSIKDSFNDRSTGTRFKGQSIRCLSQAYIKGTDRRIGIFSNTQSIYNKITIKIRMSDEPEARMQRSNIQQEYPSSSPPFQGALEMVSASVEHPSSFITDILNPPSIFNSSATTPSLSDYLKIKTKDKPKDTLKEIQDKREAFVSYISPGECADHNIVKNQSTTGNVSSRVRQQYPQFTFYKWCLENILLFIRIVPSRVSKCNIAICNIRGEVIKYYPNVFLSKKEGKIAKYISENKKSFVMVYDYTSGDSTVKVFPSLLNEAPMLYYVIFNINMQEEVLRPVCDKIQESKRGAVEHIDSKVYLISHSVLAFRPSEEMNEIFSKLSHIQDQQQQFLVQFRGKKQSWDRNLAFDMMIINMWRQFALQGRQLTERILQMFTQKEKQVSQTIVNGLQILHTPKRLQSSQNCSLCLAKNGQTKRPRRTYWICTCCSAEKEKPIYLCKGCFRDYHTNNHVYLYRKNEKKTKKYKRIIRQKLGRHRKDIKLQEKIGKNAITHSDRTLLELDRKCDEFFARLDDLIECKCYAPAQFYIQMLTNVSIVKTHQYLKKITTTEIDLIKQELQ